MMAAVQLSLKVMASMKMTMTYRYKEKLSQSIATSISQVLPKRQIQPVPREVTL